MMDFGLAGLLDRIERDFGSGWAKSLTVLIAVAIVAGCLTLIGNLITAFLLWMSGITSESTVWGKIIFIGKYMLGFGVLILIANNLASAATAKMHQKILLGQLGEASELVKEGREGDELLQENLSMFHDIVKKMAAIAEDEKLAADLRGIDTTISEHRAKRQREPYQTSI